MQPLLLMAQRPLAMHIPGKETLLESRLIDSVGIEEWKTVQGKKDALLMNPFAKIHIFYYVHPLHILTIQQGCASTSF